MTDTSITIFRTDSGITETWLRVNSDGSVTYHEENTGPRMLRCGAEPRVRVMTVDEAKADWAPFAGEIARALAMIAIRTGRWSN